MGTRPRLDISRGTAHRTTSTHRDTVPPPRPWDDESRHGIYLTPAVLEDLSEEIADRVVTRLSKQPLLVNRHGLSDRILISVATIERLQRDGRIPVVRIGRRVLYCVNSVIAALANSPVTSNALSGTAHQPSQHEWLNTRTSVETGGGSAAYDRLASSQGGL